MEQLRGLVAVAGDIGADLVLLATLAGSLPPEVEEGLAQLRQEAPSLEIRNLGLIDLERGYLLAERAHDERVD